MPQAAFVPNTTISSAAVNSDFSDIATALTGSVSADGQTSLTGILKFLSGSISTPSHTFAADTTSGLYSVATGELGIVAAALGIIVDGTASIASTVAVATGGSGYLVNDYITLTGGTFTNPIVVKVATVSGTAVSTVTITEAGRYTTQAFSPVSQGSTSGVGTEATFTVTWTTALALTDLNNNQLWQILGGTSYFATSVVSAYSGLSLANNIGSANIAAAVQTSLPLPVSELYITPTSNTPIIASDSIGATTAFLTPLNGLWTPIHNGTSIIPYQLSGQIELALTSTQSADNIFDFYLFYNSGTPVFGTGPSWNGGGSGGNVTAGSCARSTGSGGAALQRLQGVWTNAQTFTLTYNTGSGNNTVSVPINQGIYLGTVYTDHTAGQVTNHVGFSGSTNSQNRKRGYWNANNRQPLILGVYDGTANWLYGTATIRASNNVPASWSSTEYNVGSGTACNGLTVLCGLPEETATSQFIQTNESNSSGGAIWQIGVGLNSTTAFGGTALTGSIVGSSGGPIPTFSRLDQGPTLGINTYTALETWAASANGTKFLGTQTNMALTTQWRG